MLSPKPRGIRSATPGGPTEEILWWLHWRGDATAATISRSTGFSVKLVTAICLRLSVAQKYKPQRIHIVDYVYDEEGQQTYPRPLYRYGAGPNASRPAVSGNRTRKQEEYQLLKMRTITSVFDLSVPYADRIKRFRGMKIFKKGNGDASDL